MAAICFINTGLFKLVCQVDQVTQYIQPEIVSVWVFNAGNMYIALEKYSVMSIRIEVDVFP